MGLILGLFVGKQAGIFLFAWVTVKLGWAKLPNGVGWTHLYGVSILGGIGFTMSLFIAGLAFLDPEMLKQAKMGILIASILSGVIGYTVLKKAIQFKPSAS
jgi:NhaA family Na+:H+ antiporter